MTGREWITEFARRLGAVEPTDEEIDDLLALAGVAAHASERIAAPVACWVAANAGVRPATAREVASTVAK